VEKGEDMEKKGMQGKGRRKRAETPANERLLLPAAWPTSRVYALPSTVGLLPLLRLLIQFPLRHSSTPHLVFGSGSNILFNRPLASLGKFEIGLGIVLPCENGGEGVEAPSTEAEAEVGGVPGWEAEEEGREAA
jgi:hypothetical protein